MGDASILLNPLATGLSQERLVEPFAMVILGAHGDLTKRKLLPAIYYLYIDGHLPKDFCLVGMSRTKMTHEEFRKSMKEALTQFSPDVPVEDTAWERFAAKLYYLPSNFTEEGSFVPLNELLKDLAKEYGTDGKNIFYMSTPPSLYGDIVQRLADVGLAKKDSDSKSAWPRLVVEKPFGHDLASAKELNKQIHEVLDESQVYRIDHYLGKETVQNIMVLRFANGMFEPLWNRDHIDHVQITNAETLGVEGRGAYYEEAGTLRDMVQNHMLQLLSLVAMEPPISLNADDIRDERSKVLKSIRPFDCDNLDRYIVRGQYGPGYIAGQKVIGYRQESNVSPSSNRETFVALKFHIDNWRWAGIPFYVRSGKRLCKTITEIAIHFRPAPLGLFQKALAPGLEGEMETIGPNILVLQIQPEEGISLKFATKSPGATTHLRWLSMDFRYGTAFGERSPSAYERLILDCLLGDASLFARTDQVEAAWAILTPVLDTWANESKAGGTNPNFPNYAAGSWGPETADDLITEAGHAWRRL
jgi:glucose-6-phosphate 1-dehydrogenase